MPNPLLTVNQPYVFNGLGECDSSALPAGTYSLKLISTLPGSVAEGSSAGSGKGLGSGSGGGSNTAGGIGGFVQGDQGTGATTGGKGQGFGPTGGYQQPPAYGSNQTSFAVTDSTVSIVVNQNATPIFTAPAVALTGMQTGIQFDLKNIQAATNDVIKVVLTSSGAPDNALNALKTQIILRQGL